jgi:hypothetical protein
MYLVGRMLDRKYFEEVLPDQLRLMERPVRLTVHLTTGDVYVVHSLVATHDAYVVLKVYEKGKEPKHSKAWREANPTHHAAIFDQVSIPYAGIALVHLTARATKGEDARLLIPPQQK